MHKQKYSQHDSLDLLKAEEHQMIRNVPKPPSSINSKPPPPQDSSRNQQAGNSKPSIKTYDQRNNMIIGDNSYNYW